MGLFLENLEINTFRGVSNYSINCFGNWTSITGSNSTAKSSILYALSFLGSDRMHDLADIPAKIRKINPRDIPVKISYLFKLDDKFDSLISDERIINILIESIDRNYKKLKKDKFDESYIKYLESRLLELKSRKPLNEIFSDALYHAIKDEILIQQTKDKFKPLFNSKDNIKSIEEIIKNCKYLKIELNLIISNGPHTRFFLLDENKNTIIDEEVFYHWLSKMKAVDDDITLSYILGATYIKSVLSTSKENKYSPPIPATLSIDGSNIQDHIKYTLSHHPERIEKLNEYFKKIFNHTIRIRSSLPSDLVESTDEILIDLDIKNEWFSIEKLSEGMLHILRILLQFVNCKNGDILIIDEPELHLHPGALRELRDILYERKMDIQIICATHSPLILNPNFSDQIILNNYDSNLTIVPNLIDINNLELALSELGSSGLDILLYDVIIWIEGVSDELYIRSWLKLLSNQLNNVKLSDIGFVWYGGYGNLKHVDLDKIKSVNRKSIFIIDSDKNSSSDTIDQVKTDFKSYCSTEGICCWITHKKMIENYIPTYIIENKLSIPSGSFSVTNFNNIFDDLNNIGKGRSKVKLANLVHSDFTLVDINSDSILKRELEKLVETINSI